MSKNSQSAKSLKNNLQNNIKPGKVSKKYSRAYLEEGESSNKRLERRTFINRVVNKHAHKSFRSVKKYWEEKIKNAKARKEMAEKTGYEKNGKLSKKDIEKEEKRLKNIEKTRRLDQAAQQKEEYSHAEKRRSMRNKYNRGAEVLSLSEERQKMRAMAKIKDPKARKEKIKENIERKAKMEGTADNYGWKTQEEGVFAGGSIEKTVKTPLSESATGLTGLNKAASGLTKEGADLLKKPGIKGGRADNYDSGSGIKMAA